MSTTSNAMKTRLMIKGKARDRKPKAEHGTREACQEGRHTADNQGLCWWCGTIVEIDWWEHYIGKR